MTQRHNVRRVVHTAVVATVLVVAGCQSDSSKDPRQTKDVAQDLPAPVAQHAPPGERAPLERPAPPLVETTTAQVLAHKAAAYTEDLEQLMAQRAAAPRQQEPLPAPAPARTRSANSPKTAGAEPSVVEWVDPSDMSLSSVPQEEPRRNQPVPAPKPAEGAVAPAPAAKVPAPRPAASREPAQPKPVIEAAPASANQVASLVSPGDNDASSNMPSIVPEGIEDGSASPSSVPPAALDLTAAPSSDALTGKFAQRIKDNPRDVSAHLDYQLLRFLRDEQAPDLQSIAPLPTEDRELVTAVLDGLSNFRSTLRADNNTLLSRKIRPIMELADRLRSQAELSIPVATLCTRVDGFGVYEPIDPPRFIAGKDHPVIVYCEVSNFASTTNDKNLWETKLSQEAVLYTETGLEVWRDKAKPITDLSRNRRHDFFVVKMIKLPANLTIGRYLLKVSIVDQQASRVAEATVAVQMVAQ
ncbi:MAG: hypothetical protein ACREIT_05160 [Tepidisphaeraceae bacterium]